MTIKAGVIGLGFMGSAHARIYSELERCELVGVCDINPRKKYLAEIHEYKFFREIKDLLKEDLDVVSICTPAFTHKEVALQVLEKDKNILVEKPLAINVMDGEKIVRKAMKTDKLLAVGYIERFNPAVNKLREAVDFFEIYSTVSLRLGPIPPTEKNIGVLLDLGSHEIDILNHLTKIQPEILYAYVSNKSDPNFEDYAYLSLKYDNLHSHIETSWLPNYKLRIINLYGNEGMYSLNYAQQTLISYRAPPQVKIEIGNWKDIIWLSRNVEEDIPVLKAEPLRLELQCFIESVNKGKVLDPLCNGREALELLKIVEKAFNKIKTSK